MNKGPPAGNILRKQISLLPKYQLTMSPIDENSVTLELVLRNQHYLLENMEQLTAGESHKAYIVVGDSDNHLLLLSSFKDKDLISVYDGNITYKITRKCCHEHSIIAHCISSTFVGIDDQCDYLFKNLESRIQQGLPTNDDIKNKLSVKQTTIPDTFRERKRKNTTYNEISQSKEKKKRDNDLIEKIKLLKESFGKTSYELKNDLNKSAKLSTKIIQDMVHNDKTTCTESGVHYKLNENFKAQWTANSDALQSHEEKYLDELNRDDCMDDDEINSLLYKIEQEISNGQKITELNLEKSEPNNREKNNRTTPDMVSLNSNIKNKIDCYKRPADIRKRKIVNTKSNYDFIHLLEKKMYKDEEENCTNIKDTGFSETIRNHIEKYLYKTQNNAKTSNEVDELDHTLHKGNTLMIEVDDDKGNQNVSINHSIQNNIDMVELDQTTEETAVDGQQTKEIATGLVESNVTLDPSHFKITENPDVEKNTNNNFISTEHGKDKDLTRQNNLSNEIDTIGIINNTEIVLNNNLETIKTSQVYQTTSDSDKKLSIHQREIEEIENTDQSKKEKNINSLKTRVMTKNECSPILLNIQHNLSQNKLYADAYNNVPCTNNDIQNVNQPVYNYKQYCFSTSKIEVCTEDTPEHLIHVIKKVKVDFDITKIVSKKQSNSEIIINKFDDKQNNTMVITKNNNLRDIHRSNSYVHSDKRDSNEINKSEIKCSKIHKVATRTILSPNSDIYRHDISTTDLKDIKREQPGKDVKSILQKYSNIFRKSTKESPVTQISAKITNKSDNIIRRIKRPFKITDIDIIDNPTTMNTTTNKPVTPNTSIPNLINNEFENSCNATSFHVDTTNLLENISECESPTLLDIDLEPRIDNIKIEQEMLNPKTLLHCLSKDNYDEILPPPTEFRDSDNNYQNNESFIKLMETSSPQWSNNTSGEAVVDKSTFDDDLDMALTPSKEIETWTLSKDDSWELENQQSTLCTVMHQNIQSNKLIEQHSVPRQTKLGQFKFNHKTKFKITR